MPPIGTQSSTVLPFCLFLHGGRGQSRRSQRRYRDPHRRRRPPRRGGVRSPPRSSRGRPAAMLCGEAQAAATARPAFVFAGFRAGVFIPHVLPCPGVPAAQRQLCPPDRDHVGRCGREVGFVEVERFAFTQVPVEVAVVPGGCRDHDSRVVEGGDLGVGQVRSRATPRVRYLLGADRAGCRVLGDGEIVVGRVFGLDEHDAAVLTDGVCDLDVGRCLERPNLGFFDFAFFDFFLATRLFVALFFALFGCVYVVRRGQVAGFAILVELFKARRLRTVARRGRGQVRRLRRRPSSRLRLQGRYKRPRAQSSALRSLRAFRRESTLR